ncbi:MAG: calcium/sodium antiporter [Candidatus Levybacteria bacterium]|nr:calcium/sodium antiporter [Candidatus Levybacteria bacterium]MBI2190015.1 calcium/sodium antiporter [Candidatus Levybacteria bacterium]MBI2622900.1 calcium/sodium antiporter [Candidatus Levybacteria bacterium]MBI3069804.1 calcium/sodium antiporter [Candidatus Levybacteria bacterium]MBI3092857.1 calcium/sodium antiporter [Candidatus Levybacteria bacterium]
MVFPSLLFIIGFIILIKSADILIKGASSFANRLRVTSWLIGVTIVGIGTSIPEFTITVFSAIRGTFDIGLGTIIGSNTLNLLFILGICAIIRPLVLKKDWILKGLPPNILSVAVAAYLLISPFAGDKTFYGITKPEGIILTFIFLCWLSYVVLRKRPSEIETQPVALVPLKKALLMVTVGLIGVIVGGEWVVGSAIVIAEFFGISHALIGLTIVGIGTSLPELAVSALAAYRKQFGIAVGNIVGSNIFDFLGILGVASLFQPIPFPQTLLIDVFFTLFSAILLFLAMFTDKKYVLSRLQGVFFVFIYLVYLLYILQRG